MNTYIEIINLLRDKGQMIATMESCTGGSVASTITNIEGSSDVFQFGAVTYSSAYKIKLGVSRETIDIYTVYSMETAHDMAKSISEFAKANYGIGITGKLVNFDKSNKVGSGQMVYISIYDKEKDVYIDQTFTIGNSTRVETKEQIIRLVGLKMFDYLIQK